MDSQYINLLNCISNQLSNNKKNINNEIKLFNKELNIIQNNLNNINDFYLDEIAYITAIEGNIFITKDGLLKAFGFDIYNKIVYFLDKNNEIPPLVEELIQKGKKYFIFTTSDNLYTIYEPINFFEKYPNIQFIGTYSTLFQLSQINNLKQMIPNNIIYALNLRQSNSIQFDYYLLNTNFKELKFIGFYDKNNVNSLELKIITDFFFNENLFTINWFDINIFIDKDEDEINKWKKMINNIDFYFNFIWITENITFLNEYIDIYTIKNYLLISYFTFLLNLKFDDYLKEPFNSILSKGHFFFIDTKFFNLYSLIQDAITSIRMKDSYQISNIYYDSSIKFGYNKFLNNENSLLLLYPAKFIFNNYSYSNNFEKNYIDFINTLTNNNFIRFIRLNINFQFSLINKFIQVKNNYLSLNLNAKFNFSSNFIEKYNNLNYGFLFNGALIKNSSITFLPTILPQFGDIITNYNIPLLSKAITTGKFSEQVNLLNSIVNLRISSTMFNTSFRKNIYFNNNQNNASNNLIQRIQSLSLNFMEYMENEFNFMNKLLQNMLWFYIYSAENININETFYWSALYLPEKNFNNKFKIRLLLNYIDDINEENTYIGFENKIGNSEINSTIPNYIYNLGIYNTFINRTNIENNEFNNFLIGSDYYDDKFIPKDYNNFNFLLDLKKIYLTLQLLNLNNINNNIKLQNIMISIYQEYLVKDDWLQQQIIINPNFNPISDIPWNNILENIGTIFEKNNKFYNFRYQMKDLNEIGYQSSKFYLWTEGDKFDINENIFDFTRMIKTKFIDNQIVIDDNNKIGVQYSNFNTNKQMYELYLDNTNNVNSIDVNLYRKLYNNNIYNNFLFDLFSKDDNIENWIETANYFKDKLNK